MNHPQSVLLGVITVRVDVSAMATLGLVFLALATRAALGIVVVVALVWLVLKLGRLADAYTKKLQTK